MTVHLNETVKLYKMTKLRLATSYRKNSEGVIHIMLYHCLSLDIYTQTKNQNTLSDMKIIYKQ